MKRVRLQKPITNGNGFVGQDPVSGKFVKGNQGGPGNPYASKVQRMRKALMEAVSPEDVKAITRMLVKLAKSGDVPSAKVILERLYGKPFQQLHLTTDEDAFTADERFL